MATRPGGESGQSSGNGLLVTERAFRPGFGSPIGCFRPDLGPRSSWMIFSAQRTWGRRTNSHALLRNFAPSGIPAPHRGGAFQISGRTLLESSVGFARRARARERPLEKKSSAPSCVSSLWTFHFLSREPASPASQKWRRPPRRSREQAQLAGIAARVSTINGLEVSPRHAGRHPEEWLFDTGRQIIPPPAVSGRRFAGAGPRSTVRPARQACRSVDEKFRPAEPEQSSRSWRTWL